MVMVGTERTGCSSEAAGTTTGGAVVVGIFGCDVTPVRCGVRFRSYVRAAADPKAAIHTPKVTASAVRFLIGTMT
jgi:hypothetical protein